MADASEERTANDYIQLALAYFDNNDMRGARRHVNNAFDIDNRISDGYMVLAMVFRREGNLDLADSNFLRAISLDQNNSRARNNYATMLFSQERFRESYEQLERVAGDTSYEGRALFAGIQIEGYFQNVELVENFSLVLAALYPTSPEFQTFQRLNNVN